MNNSDYIPLDPAVIDQEVIRKSATRSRAKNVVREELKNAGGNVDIIVFPRKDYSRFKRMIKALEELRLFWCEVDGEIYVNRHEVYEVVR